MKITHHISDELLLEYASGSLSEGWSVAVATHMALCPHCRTRLIQVEEAGAQLLETLENKPAPSDDVSWAAIKDRLANVKQEQRKQQILQEASAAKPDVPEPLRSYLGGGLKTLKWRALGLGAYHYPIPMQDKSVTARLLRIPAGKPVPEHGHGGRELTLVLTGSFNDGDMRFGPGDFEETDDTIEHQPVAEPVEDCICLAVTDAPLRFRSRIVRLIQPLLGI